MKSLFVSALVLTAFAGAAHAESTSSIETAYPSKAIGYDALAAGDNARAINDMMSGSVSRNDPAFLLNLGQAYARTGRIAEAREMFRAAARKRENVDLVLADGRVIGSKQAAYQALATVQVGLAVR
jgi:Flp pilus assembly protein TadD